MKLKAQLIINTGILCVILCGLLLFLGIIIYSEIILISATLAKYILFTVLLICLDLVILWLNTFCLVYKISYNDNSILLCTLFKTIEVEDLESIKVRDNRFLLYIKTEQQRYLIIKHYYKEHEYENLIVN